MHSEWNVMSGLHTVSNDSDLLDRVLLPVQCILRSKPRCPCNGHGTHSLCILPLGVEPKVNDAYKTYKSEGKDSTDTVTCTQMYTLTYMYYGGGWGSKGATCIGLKIYYYYLFPMDKRELLQVLLIQKRQVQDNTWQCTCTMIPCSSFWTPG